MKITSDSAVDGGDLLLDGHGDVLALLEQLSQSDTSVEELLSGSVKIGPELGESCDLNNQNEPAARIAETRDLPLCTEPTRASWNRPPAS